MKLDTVTYICWCITCECAVEQLAEVQMSLDSFETKRL